MKIQITKGSVSPGEVSQYHLVTNHLIDPNSNCDKVISYAEKRYLMTLLVSGAMRNSETVSGYTPEGGNTIATKIKPIPEAELVAGNSWSYEVMGRIQKAVEILGSADVGVNTNGTATEGGEFKLHLRDNYIGHGMVVTFAGGYQARVKSVPVRVGGEKWLYTFKCFPGDTFSWTTWVAVQSGTKTCFGSYSSYGEKSVRGYAAFHYPDKFINHTTVQRKSFSISGHANVNEVRWYTLGDRKGFVYEAEAQMRAQMLLEDEDQKWNGVSTMRDVYGNLLARPSMYEDDGEPIFAGDGLIEQIKGANDMESSNADGTFTYDDLADMVNKLKSRKNMMEGNKWIVATGTEGMSNADDVISNRVTSAQPMIQSVPNDKVGGAEPNVGYNFKTLNIAGQQITFVENPMFSDLARYPKTLSNGKSAKGSTLYFLDMAVDEAGVQNIEIRAAGRSGVNRNLVYLWEEGMTGGGRATKSEDAKSFHMLKDNMLIARRTISMGIMSPSATA